MEIFHLTYKHTHSTAESAQWSAIQWKLEFWVLKVVICLAVCEIMFLAEILKPLFYLNILGYDGFDANF